MHIRRHRAWEMPEHQATPESVFLDRRRLLGGAAGLAAASLIGLDRAEAAGDSTADLYPAKRNEAYTLDRALTPEKYSADYNNFYEFGTSKSVLPAANALKTRPWTVTIDGLVEKPMTLGVDDIIRKMALEERLYRHRCVEAWSMSVPWTGFPCPSWWHSPSPPQGPSTSRCRPSSTARWRRVRNPSCIPGPTPRA